MSLLPGRRARWAALRQLNNGRQKEGGVDRLRRLSGSGRLLLALAVGGALFGIATAVGERTRGWTSAGVSFEVSSPRAGI
jgi:hypothetical protein